MKLLMVSWLSLTAPIFAGALTFTETSKEIQAAADAKTVTADFEFTNNTDKNVVITKSDGGCSCVSVQISGGKLSYAPGESGVVRANFSVGNFSGQVDKHVQLWTDGDPSGKPSETLAIKINIPVLISIEPKTLKWAAGAEAKPQKIKILMQDTTPIHISNVSLSTEAFSYDLETIKDGEEYELTVTPAETEKVGTLGIIRIQTDSTQDRYRLQQAFAVIQKQG